MVEPGTGRHQEEKKGLARNQKGKFVGRKKRLETFRPLVHVKRGRYERKRNQYY
jgi:hypothetical protein